MPVPSKNWTNILDAQIASDKPIDTTLLTEIRDNLVNLKEWLGVAYTPAQNHNHDGVNSASVITPNMRYQQFTSGGAYMEDDFAGAALDTIKWLNDANVTLPGEKHGKARVGHDTAQSWNGLNAGSSPLYLSASNGNTLIIEVKVKRAGLFGTQPRICIGFLKQPPIAGHPAGENNTITPNAIFFDNTESSAWRSNTNAGAGLTQTTLAAAPATTYQTLRIEAQSGSVKFFVNGILVATHTTNIPAPTQALAVMILTSGSGGWDSADVDYVVAYADVRD